MTQNYAPAPADRLNLPGQDWGERTLIDCLISDGWVYFVQFNRKQHYYSAEDRRRWLAAARWCEDHALPFRWVGGRFQYEFVFKKEEHACFFKLHWG